MPRGEQEEKKEERTGERQDDDTTRDRLAAAANENLKKDNKKPIEEHEEDWTKKTDLKRKEGHPDRACRRGLTLWPASVFLQESPTRRGQEDDKERTRRGHSASRVAFWGCLASASPLCNAGLHVVMCTC